MLRRLTRFLILIVILDLDYRQKSPSLHQLLEGYDLPTQNLSDACLHDFEMIDPPTFITLYKG